MQSSSAVRILVEKILQCAPKNCPMPSVRAGGDFRLKPDDEIILVLFNVSADIQKRAQCCRQVIDLCAFDVRVIERSVAFCLRAKIARIATVENIRAKRRVTFREPLRWARISDGGSHDNPTFPSIEFAVTIHRFCSSGFRLSVSKETDCRSSSAPANHDVCQLRR